ncbi:hypothetical protein MMC13_007056 [Lambiella insularis]|nr:hypothetical protein [Lambiella insularis]
MNGEELERGSEPLSNEAVRADSPGKLSKPDTRTYKVVHATPSVDNYISLRAATDLTPKSQEATAIGLSNTLFAVQVALCASPDTIIGMGRLIGDGGCFFFLVDMAVLPAHQGKGVGKMIMKELKAWMDNNVPKSGTVLLLADGKAKELYKQYGFVETSGMTISSVGMACRY